MSFLKNFIKLLWNHADVTFGVLGIIVSVIAVYLSGDLTITIDESKYKLQGFFWPYLLLSISLVAFLVNSTANSIKIKSSIDRIESGVSIIRYDSFQDADDAIDSRIKRARNVKNTNFLNRNKFYNEIVSDIYTDANAYNSWINNGMAGYWYDVVDTNTIFVGRYKTISKMQTEKNG